MPKIERRRTTVTLYQGNYEAELADLLDQTMSAQRTEDSSGGRRHGTKSPAVALAKQYDDLVAEAEKSAVKVTLWAISYTEWGPLADRHPPRDDNAKDARSGVNMATFPAALTRASLVEPGTASDLDDQLAKGETALAELGDLSQLHYAKLEHAAWDVNVGDDALPKYSLVSQLKLLRDPDSKQPNDSE